MDTVERTEVATSTVYDGFISYSHVADGLLAPRLQSGLQRFAKPWWKRRALRIFRDESSLAANPHLWSSITDALDSSAWFVLLLSPDAAVSQWVNQEIDYWRTHRDSSRILPVVSDGDFGWEGDVTGDAVPEALRGVFSEEPRWVDLRFARDEEQLDLKDPRFADAVADIASALRGMPKDELASEEVRQHRRTIRTAWSAGALVVLLAGVASVFAFQASRQAQLALARELAASAVNVLSDDPELAVLLTLEAIDRTPAGIDQPPEVIDALWKAARADRLIDVIDTGTDGPVGIALSAAADVLAASSVEDATLRLYSLPDGIELWSYTEDTTDSFGLPFVSPDGRMVAVGVWDSAGPPSRAAVGERPPDDRPARVVMLDSRDGSVIERLEYGGCPGANPVGWSPQGTYFAVTHVEPCPRPGVSNDAWVEILDGDTFERVALVDTVEGVAPVSTFDSSENLYVFGVEDRGGLELYRAPSFDRDRVIEEVTGFGDVAPDGSAAVTWDPSGDAIGFSVYDLATGRATDHLRPLPSFPGGFYGGPTFSMDGRRLVMADSASTTPIWDIETGERVFHLGGGPATNSIVTEDGARLYSGHTDGRVRIWDVTPGGGIGSVDDLGSHEWINANAFSIGPDLGAAVAIDRSPFDSRIVFFDRATGVFRGEPVPAWTTPALPLADDRFVLRSPDGVWIVHDPATGAQRHLAGCPTDRSGRVCTGSGGAAPEVTVRTSVDGTELAVGVDGAPFELIDPDTGSVIGPLLPGVDIAVEVLTRDWILGVDPSTGSSVVVDRATGEELARLDLPRFFRAAVSETGETIAVLEDALAGVVVVDTLTWKTSRVPLSLGNVRGVAIAPDERRLALGDENGLHIAERDAGAVTLSIPLPSVSDNHWLDPDTVLVGGTDGMWARIDLRVQALIQLATENLTRGFTTDECDRYRIDPCPSLDEMQAG